MRKLRIYLIGVIVCFVAIWFASGVSLIGGVKSVYNNFRYQSLGNQYSVHGDSCKDVRAMLSGEITADLLTNSHLDLQSPRVIASVDRLVDETVNPSNYKTIDTVVSLPKEFKGELGNFSNIHVYSNNIYSEYFLNSSKSLLLGRAYLLLIALFLVIPGLALLSAKLDNTKNPTIVKNFKAEIDD